MYIYVCTRNPRTHTYIYIRIHVSSSPSARPYPHPWPRASECLHVCARARASAVPPRTTGRAASEARPSASAIVRVRLGQKGGAYKGQRGDRGSVPRADVGVERRRRDERLRAEATTRSTPTGKGAHGLGFWGSGRARSTSPPTRAHTADPSPIAHWCTHA
jgi:hypothetical protein